MLCLSRIVVIALLPCCGCALWTESPGEKRRPLLLPAAPSADSVTLEVFYVRVPAGDKLVSGPLWDTVDEQRLPATLRRHMTHNGLRAGLVGSQASPELARLLQLTGDPIQTDPDEGFRVKEEEPGVRRRMIQGKRGQILTSGIYDKLQMLVREDEQLRGQTYHKAQGVLEVTTAANADGSVRVSLTPELHHGEPRQQWTGSEGMLRMEMARPHETYERLRAEFDLSVGQMIVVSCYADRPGSLGERFFHDPATTPPEHKMLVIRLLRAPTRDANAPATPNPIALE